MEGQTTILTTKVKKCVSQSRTLFIYIFISDDGRHILKRYKIRQIDCSHKHDLSVLLTSATNLGCMKNGEDDTRLN